MSFEGKPRPIKVERAIKSGDRAAILSMAKAGGKAAGEIKAKEKDERLAWRDIEAEMHEKSMHDAAMARKDDELSDP